MHKTIELIDALAAAIEERDPDRIIVVGASLAQQLAEANPEELDTYTAVAALTRSFAADARRGCVVRMLEAARPVACA